MREYKRYTYMNRGNTSRSTRVKQYKGSRIQVYKETYKYERKKSTHEFTKGKLERLTRGLEGWSSERSTGVHATAAPL